MDLTKFNPNVRTKQAIGDAKAKKKLEEKEKQKAASETATEQV